MTCRAIGDDGSGCNCFAGSLVGTCGAGEVVVLMSSMLRTGVSPEGRDCGAGVAEERSSSSSRLMTGGSIRDVGRGEFFVALGVWGYSFAAKGVFSFSSSSLILLPWAQAVKSSSSCSAHSSQSVMP